MATDDRFELILNGTVLGKNTRNVFYYLQSNGPTNGAVMKLQEIFRLIKFILMELFNLIFSINFTNHQMQYLGTLLLISPYIFAVYVFIQHIRQPRYPSCEERADAYMRGEYNSDSHLKH